MSPTSNWAVDYNGLVPRNPSSVRDPPGYTTALAKPSNKNATAMIKPANLDSLRRQKAWEVALAPAKNVPMQAFMMYMTGGGVQIFSVMSVWFLLKQAVGGMLSVNKAFAPFETSKPGSTTPTQSYLAQKAVFVLCQIGLLLVGLWKCNSMGLLPTHESDWLAFEPPKVYEVDPNIVILS